MVGCCMEFGLDSKKRLEVWLLRQFETLDPFDGCDKLESSVCSVALDCKSSCENLFLVEDDLHSVLEDLVPILQQTNGFWERIHLIEHAGT